MKSSSTRFLLLYGVVVFIIFSFFYTLTALHREQLVKLDREIMGVSYINNLYLFTNNFIEYKFRVDRHENDAGLEKLQVIVMEEISNLQSFRKKNFTLDDDSFLLNSISSHLPNLEDEYFYNVLEWINEENYRVGDSSGLLFQSDRKIYYLNSLITHYLPEYVISLSVVRNILYYQSKIGMLSQKTQETYIEEMNLVSLSSSEVGTIIEFLQQYKDMQIFSKLKNKIDTKLALLPKQESDIDTSLETVTSALLYVHRLNKKTINTLDTIYKVSRDKLHQTIWRYLLVALLISFVVALLLLYLHSLYEANREKEQNIIGLNQRLDKLVIFAKTDAQGYIVHVSEAFLNLSGFSKDVFIGRVHPLFTKIQKIPEGEWSRELKETARDGSVFWLHLSVIPEYDKKDILLGYIIYGIDITYQKEIEAQKQKTQEALEFKSKFLSNMSHEIRTPLNAIIGFSTVAMRTNLDAHQKELMHKIDATSQLLLGIINDILDISKIESGKMEIEEKEFNLKELVDDVKNILQIKADEKGIDLLVEYKEIEHFYYYGDTLRVSQILVNLISNAIKFTDEGYVKLLISRKDEKLYFEVVDTGIGLKEESLESLFEEFTQADMSTSRKYGGSGLGLSISKNLVAMMGGSIGVRSTYGEGSCFYFTLDLKEAEAVEETESADDAEFSEVEERVNQLEGIKILVAEDNKMNQMVLNMLLEDTNFALEYADDGKIAVEKFKEGEYNLILMDLQMPNMDGYEATKKIREIDSEIVIIALSANVMSEDIQRAYEAGVNDYLSKPIDLEKIYRMLLKYL